MTALAENTWIEVGRATDVPLYEGRRVTLHGHRIAVFRTDDGLHAIGADCPHAAGPLQDGLVADDCVTCPLHGRRFDLRTGAPLAGGDDPVAAYEVTERDGALLLRLPDEPGAS